MRRGDCVGILTTICSDLEELVELLRLWRNDNDECNNMIMKDKVMLIKENLEERYKKNNLNNDIENYNWVEKDFYIPAISETYYFITDLNVAQIPSEETFKKMWKAYDAIEHYAMSIM